MHVNQNFAKVAALALLMLLLRLSTPTAFAAPVSGAIFTTDATGNFVNANVYDSVFDVYLNGGPRPNAPCSAAGLPDGEYYFQVTDPSGSLPPLSSDDISDRKVRVLNGMITDYLGTTPNRTSTGSCGDVTVQLYPFDNTPNPGGEYKVWMTPVTAYNTYGGFMPQYSKTDNFKVLLPECVDSECP